MGLEISDEPSPCLGSSVLRSTSSNFEHEAEPAISATMQFLASVSLFVVPLSQTPKVAAKKLCPIYLRLVGILLVPMLHRSAATSCSGSGVLRSIIGAG
jgi:hypothetical protein